MLAAIEPEQMPALVVRLAALQSALGALMTTRIRFNGSAGIEGDQDHLLDVSSAAEVLGVSKHWLYRNSTDLPFTRKLGRKLRFSRHGMDRWIQARLEAYRRIDG